MILSPPFLMNFKTVSIVLPNPCFVFDMLQIENSLCSVVLFVVNSFPVHIPRTE